MLARRSLIIILSNLLGGLGGLVVLFVVGHYMGPGPYGMVGFSLSVVGLGAFLARLGVDTAHKKRVSEGTDLRLAMGTYVRLKLMLVAAFAALIVVGATVWQRTTGFVDATTYPVLLVMLAFVVLMEVRMVPIATFDAFLQSAKGQAVMIVEQLVRVPAAVAVALVFGALSGRWVPLEEVALWLGGVLGLQAPLAAADGALLLAAAFAAAMLVSAAFAWWLLWRAGTPVGAYDRATARSYWRFALPAAVLTVSSTMLMEMDRFMIGYFWQSHDVGHYYAAQRLLQVALLLPSAVAIVFFPLISELAARRSGAGVREVVAATQRALTLLIVPIILCFALFAREGITILQTAAFAPAAPMLAILCLFALVVTFSTVANTVVLGYDRPRVAAIVGLLMVAVNAVCNALLIPDSLLGIQLAGAKGVGAAWSTLIAQVVGTVVLVLHARRLTGTLPIGLPTLRHLAAGAVLVPVILWAKRLPIFGGLDRFHELAAIGALVVAAYAGLLVLVRELDRRDWILLRDVFNPRKMARHIRDEFIAER